MSQSKIIPEAERCVEPRIPDESGWHYSQCSRRGTITEEDKLWCFQHAPSAIRKRRAKSHARYEADMERHMAPSRERDRLRAINNQLLAALEEIAEGSANPDHSKHCRQQRRIARKAIREANK